VPSIRKAIFTAVGPKLDDVDYDGNLGQRALGFLALTNYRLAATA
jgi:hypothetical protein